MSATANPGTGTSAAGETRDFGGDPGQAAGSPRDTDTGDGAGSQDGDQGGNRQGEDSDEGLNPKELRRQMTELQAQLGNHSEFNRVLASLPNWPQIRSQIERALAGEDPAPQQGQPENEFAEIDAIAEELLGDKADVLKKFARKLEQRAEERARTAVKPLARQAMASAQEVKFQTGLRKAGLDPTIAEDADFQQFQREFMADNPFMRSALRGEDAVAAAKLLGDEFKRRARVPEQYLRERQRINDARNQPESRGSRGGATRAADGAVVVSRAGGPKAILDAIRKGASPDSIRVTD